MARGGKRYVDVIALWHASGYVEPLIVRWPDGRSFQIESIEGKPQSNTFPGNPNRILRYTVQVEDVRTQLFLEHGADGTEESARWFVEQRAGSAIWKLPWR